MPLFKFKNRSEETLKRIEGAKRFNPDFAHGLNKEQVELRIEQKLANKTKKQVTKSYFRIFADNVFSFFNLLFIATAVLMMIAGITTISSYLFLLILFANIVIGLISDIRARILVDRLRVVTDPKATVYRNGKRETLNTSDIVLDDILVLKAGDTVPCDCLIREGDLTVDESLLTGESEPVRKKVNDELLSGSIIKAGHSYVQAIKVGAASYSETLRTSAQKFERPRSEIKQATMRIFVITATSALVVALMMILTYVVPIGIGTTAYTAEGFTEFVRSLSGSIIAAVPTGLYLLTSLTLSVGLISLARKRMNVQQLYSIEMLARVDTVCFDKTGTLTDGTMTVAKTISLNEKYSEEELMRIAYSLVRATKDDNSTAAAILHAGEGLSAYQSTKSLAFDSFNKYSAAALVDKGTFVLGAYGFVPAQNDIQVLSRIHNLTEQGYRVIVLYSCKKDINGPKITFDCTPIGIFALGDCLKADAKENIQWFIDNGVNIRVISGDDPMTVAHIAKEAGVPHPELATSLEGVKEEEIAELAKKYVIFGRVSPEQKAWLIKAMQKEGHCVAMTGDGVNDILALKAADCSIAMASGSAAARNIAHIVAIDNDFSHLPEVVGEGRRVINNLQRSASLFLAKNIFAITFSLIFLISTWVGGEAYPFTTQNLLIWEILSIGVPAFFLSLQPTKERLKGSFLTNILEDAIPAGIAEVLVVGLIFIAYLINPNFINFNTAKTLSIFAFSIISFCTLFRVSLPPNKYRLIVFGVCLFLALGVADISVLASDRFDFLGLELAQCNLNTPNIAYAGTITIAAAVLFMMSESIRSAVHKRLKKESKNENS